MEEVRKKNKIYIYISLLLALCLLGTSIYFNNVNAETLNITKMGPQTWSDDPQHWLLRLDKDYPNVMKRTGDIGLYDSYSGRTFRYSTSIWGIGGRSNVSLTTVNGATHMASGGYNASMYCKNDTFGVYDGWTAMLGGTIFTEHFDINGNITYCFDLNTPASTTVNKVSLNQINHYKSNAELVNIAKAAAMLTKDNFKFFRDNASLFAKEVPAVTFNGESLPAVAKNDIVTMLSANTADTNKFLRSLVQCMVWYHANNAADFFDSLGGALTLSGGAVGGKDDIINASGGYIPPYRGVGYMVDFNKMYAQALAEFNMRLQDDSYQEWLWQKWYSIKPGETLTLSGNEGNRVWQIYQDNGYFGSSQLQVSRNSSNQTVIHAPTTITPFTGEWQDSVTINDVSYAVLANGQYVNRNKPMWEGDRPKGQFIVDASSVKAIRAGIDVKQVDKYLYVTKKVPTGFSANGATFGVYKSQADANSNSNRLTTLSITNGKSDVYKYTPTSGENTITLYVKELTAPTSSGDYEWVKDTTVKPVTLTESNSTPETAATVEFTNNVIHYGYLQVHKDVPTGHVPTGAEYTIYQDANCTTELPADKFISGTKEKLIIKSTKDSNVVGLRISSGDNITVYVKETKQPNETGDFTWQMDNNIYPVTVNKDTTKTAPVRVNSENRTTEYGYVTVKKAVAALGVTTNPQNVSPYGARYAVFDTREHAQAWIDNQSITGILGLIGIDANGNGAANVTNVNEQAHIRLPLLPTGINSWETKKVYVVETKLPNEVNNDKFIWDRSELSKIYEATVTKDSTSAAPVMVNSTNRYEEQAWVYVEKELNVSADNSNAMNISGTVAYSIKDDANTEVATLQVVFAKGKIVSQSQPAKLKVGNYTITEVSTPNTIVLNSTPKPFTLTRRNDKDNPYKVSFKNDTVAQLSLTKTSDRPDLLSKYPITGAQYTVYTNSSYSAVAKDINGNNVVFTIKADGSADKSYFMTPGTYYIKETKVPENYEPGTINPNPITLKSGDIKTIEAENILEPSKIKVKKEY